VSAATASARDPGRARRSAAAREPAQVQVGGAVDRLALIVVVDLGERDRPMARRERLEDRQQGR